MSTTTYSPGTTPLGTGSTAAGAASQGTAARANVGAAESGAAAAARSAAALDAAPVPAPATKLDADAEASMPAAERMEASRRRLRSAMQQIAHPPARPPSGGTAGKALHAAQSAVSRVQAMPGATLLAATLERWWARHPLHDAAVVAGAASRRAIVPYAQRNPVQLVLGAVAVGAVLVLLRPWRLLLRRRMLFALLPHFLATAVKQLPAASLAMISSRLDGAPAQRRAARAAARATAGTTAGSVTPQATTSPRT